MFDYEVCLNSLQVINQAQGGPTQALAYTSQGLAEASLGLAKVFHALALASHGLAWTSQSPDLASQGLARASLSLAWASPDQAQASGGRMDGQTDGQMDFFPILQDFVPYQDCCPASHSCKLPNAKAGQGNRWPYDAPGDWITHT